MIFKKLGAALWHYSDVILFLAAAVCIDIAAFYAGVIWFYLALAGTFALCGWLTEAIGSQKGGD